jgi:predicted nucleic acid-binding protein
MCGLPPRAVTRYLVDTNVISASAPSTVVRRSKLIEWMDSHSPDFDSPIAEIAGALSDLAGGRGHSPGFADIVIAATARRHELTILSRNHFAPMDVAVVGPFQRLSPGGWPSRMMVAPSALTPHGAS